MANDKLENLVRIGRLKAEPASEEEIAGLLRSGVVRLADAKNENLSKESRFDLAYNAAHALSLAALRRAGFRSESRYLFFSALSTPWISNLSNGECSIRLIDKETWRSMKAALTSMTSFWKLLPGLPIRSPASCKNQKNSMREYLVEQLCIVVKSTERHATNAPAPC
jgi:hypothetical protein